VAILMWGTCFANKSMTIRSDNEAVCHIINKGVTRDKKMMLLLRKMVIQCLEHNIFVKAKHIPGVENVAVDALSRNMFQSFLEVKPHKDMNYRGAGQSKTGELEFIFRQLVSRAQAPGTRDLYQRTWNELVHFGQKMNCSIFPLSEVNLSLFIAEMHQLHYAPSSIRIFVSAIAYVHKMGGLKDPSSLFYSTRAKRFNKTTGSCRCQTTYFYCIIGENGTGLTRSA
ncbi:unnamed protein product, partial [Owenia fusiformis]